MPTAKHDNAPRRRASPPGGEREWWLLVALFWATVALGSGLIWILA